MAAADPPRRSDATRAEILRAAQSRFAHDGYQKATIRAIAADAGIDPSMVMRYYGSKERLFAAAVDLDLRLPDFTSIPRRQLGATLVRSAATDETAARRLYGIFRQQLVPAVADLVGDPDEAVERAGLISTQLLGLALCRRILRLAPVAALSPEAVVTWIGPTIQRYVTGPLPRA